MVPSLVPYDFANVDIEAEAFHREGVEIPGVVREGRVMEEDLNCLYRLAFYLLDLTLNNRQENIELVGAKFFGSLQEWSVKIFNSKSMADVKYLNDYVDL